MPSDLDSDLDALVSTKERRRRGNPCLMGQIMEQLPESTRERLLDVMGRSDISSAQIAEALQKWGYQIAYPSVTRHRRRHNGGVTGCACP